MTGLIGTVTGAAEIAVAGVSTQFEGVRGTSHAASHGGVVGMNDNPTDTAGPGVYGESAHGEGVRGISHSPNHGAVVGTCDNAAQGVFGESTSGEGVRGISHSPDHGGVVGTCDNAGPGVQGNSPRGRGVAGFSDTSQGVYGFSKTQAGVVGESNSFDGVFGISHSPQHAGISGHNPGGLAGFFDGNVTVTGDLFLAGGDCAERFASAGPAPIEPGTVMSIQDDGSLSCSETAYDRRVAGVASGAGTIRPAIILNSKDPGAQNGTTLALVGRVYCKVDASYAPIETGDLLTTSPTLGHAMKVSDPLRGFGAVLGKALMPRSEGCGLIPILVALQ